MMEKKILAYHDTTSDEQIQEELISHGLSMPTVYISRVHAVNGITNHCDDDEY